jgi:hypothetical protein
VRHRTRAERLLGLCVDLLVGVGHLHTVRGQGPFEFFFSFLKIVILGFIPIFVFDLNSFICTPPRSGFHTSEPFLVLSEKF